MKRNWLRWLGWTLAIVVIAGGAWAGYRYFDGKKEAPLAAAQATTQVRKGTIEVKVSGTGNIQPSARETVTAGSSGTVEKVHAKKGDTVKKGDVLVTYEEEDNSSQLRSKEIDLKKKKLELQDLQTKFKSAADDESRDAVALSIQKQELDIESVQADIASLKTDNGTEPVLAPIDGVLTSFEVKAGDTVNPNTTVGEIVNYAQLQMVVGIDELDIPKVKLDQEASILVEALPDQTFTGKVVTIADEGTSSNGVASFDVTIALAAADNLKVGMSAEASILTAQKTDALYVPVEAVQSSQGKYFVLVPASASEGAVGAGAPSSEATSPARTDGAQGGQARQGQRGTGQAREGQEGTAEAQQGQEETGQAQQGAGQAQQGQEETGQAQQGTGQAQQGQKGTGQAQAGPGAGGETLPGGFAPGGEGGTERFGNLSEEEREAMRERFMAERGQGGGAAAAGGGAFATARVEVQVGVNNEDNIEIVSGLKEGDLVVLPTTSSSGANRTNMQSGFPGLGGGAFPAGGGGGSFSGGGGMGAGANRQFAGGGAGAGGGR
ncbi:efflux RND transporter periplasmic adaptor subunit [Cohnella cellulosilytica]|uniref:Efflux RND transporter periplasmic adaptor subunit n=1 Tax=Cohnella cellulosilytica TaxID=986710 RepID=A0ABW2F583_9BACL